MRQVKSHKGDVLNDALTITTAGPRIAGANYWYYIIRPDEAGPGGVGTFISFQRGDPADGINGISNEALLAIVEDRLAGFQSGPFACEENDRALLCVRGALSHLHSRTAVRRARGVEGKPVP